MKVLLIGGAGFIGFHLTKYLVDETDYKITIADNFSRGQLDDELNALVERGGIRIVEGDFTRPEAFANLDSMYDQVYMLASVVGVNNTLEIPHEVIRINTALIFNTLEWVKRSSIGKVLYTSTSECYAGTVDSFGYIVPTPESIPLCISEIGHPRFTYAVTKMLGESGFLNYSKNFPFECTIVRYHNVFGPRMGFKHVIPHLVQRFRNQEDPFKIYGAEQTRSFCYVNEAVKGTVLAMENSSANGEIFHIGTMEEITIKELIQTSGEFFNFNGKYIDAPTYPGSVSRRCPDITKARNLLGFEPTMDWKVGLTITLQWYQDFFESGVDTFETAFETPAHDK